MATITRLPHGVRCSAPGKVLILGGYVILVNPRYRGCVLSTTARFHATVESATPGCRVASPQFDGDLGPTDYTITATDKDVQVNLAPSSGHRAHNPFVAACLRFATMAVPPARRKKVHIRVKLVGDDAFYDSSAKRSGTDTTTTTTTTPRGKTGLGSSAALTTALVGALLVHLGAIDNIDTEETAAFHHRVAQIAHCAAQGKVGSGFDVASACYGTMLYNRFDPKQLDPLPQTAAQIRAETLLADAICQRFAMPPRIICLLGAPPARLAGTKTVGMVKRVLKGSGAAKVLAQLAVANERTLATLGMLRDYATRQPTRYHADIDDATGARIMQNTTWSAPCAAFAHVRTLLRALHPQVEPEAQTQLCDATQKVPGVIMCGVPGAGGFDAVFCLVTDTQQAAVRTLWDTLGVALVPVRAGEAPNKAHL